MKTAFIFPGQGAQKVGMGRDLFDASPAARAVFEEANDALGEDLSKLIFEGPAEDLTLTANTQPAILTVSIAAWRAFSEKCDIEPTFVAGHSLGEFSALVASGTMKFSDAVRTTRARGKFMQEAVSAGHGAMAAIMKKESNEVFDACREAAQGQIVSPANFNSPGQVVISGDADAVKRASELLAASGGKVIPLKVSAPFHCALMEPAARGLDDFLATITFDTPKPAVVTNVEAVANDNSQRVRELLVKQVTSTVRWTDSIRFMLEAGVKNYFEFGPGNVLAGLMRKIEKTANVVSVNSINGLDKALETLR